MLKNELAIGVLKQSGEGLAHHVAMWENVTLWNVLAEKTQSTLRKLRDGTDIEDLAKSLEASAKDLFRCGDDELRLRLVWGLAQHLEVRVPPNTSAGELDEVCHRICQRGVALLREQDDAFKGETVQEMASYQLKKFFDDLGNKFDSQSAPKQEAIVEQVMSAIRDMPEEQRDRLRRELGADDLSDAVVRNAIVTGGLGAAFATVVNVAGFSPYIVAVKILAGAAGLVGITLPFAVYTTLTSMIAFLSNPVTLAFLLAGGVWLMNRFANRRIRSSLVPILVTQLVAASAFEGNPGDGLEPLLKKLAAKVRLG